MIILSERLSSITLCFLSFSPYATVSVLAFAFAFALALAFFAFALALAFASFSITYSVSSGVLSLLPKVPLPY
jgi:hypothetical protein